MKKPNRRSKRTSDSSTHSKQHHHGEGSFQDSSKEKEALKGEIGSVHLQNFRGLEEQVTETKMKQITQSGCSTRRQKTYDARRFDEIQKLKAQKVQLLCKLKLESVQFRLSRASLEKEVLQLKKELRRNTYEMRKLLALNQRQKLVLQRKTEEASLSAKRLNDLLQNSRSGSKNGSIPGIQVMELELKVAARVEEIKSDYERQMEEMAEEVRKFEEEAEMLREENLRYLVQEKELDCAVRDSELRDLKEEVVRLSNLVSQLGMPKMPLVHLRNPQVDMNRFSISVGSSIKLLNTDASESKNSGGNTAAMEKPASTACCSCSKKSFCKTTKCECRAANACCGPRCGCVASKCTNREILNKVHVDDLLQSEMPQTSVHLSDSSEPGKSMVASQPSELKNDNPPRRKPLCEIGNTLINSSPAKPGKKTRRSKAAAQRGMADDINSL